MILSRYSKERAIIGANLERRNLPFAGMQTYILLRAGRRLDGL